MQSLIQDLKKDELGKIYLLYGEEDYLRKQYRDKLKEKLVAPDDTMNYHYFEGKNVQIGEIIDLAETMPFFADQRVIFLENTELVKKGGEQLAEYLKDMAETVSIVLVEKEIDKRSKLYKAIQKAGKVCEFKEQTINTLKIWVLSLLKKENKKITEYTMHTFLEKTGTNMDEIKMELEKLICYTMGKEEITVEDVEIMCTQKVSDHIFEMVDAIANQEQKKALTLYYDLLTLRESPIKIIALLGRQFNILLQVKLLKKKGYGDNQLSTMVGIPSYFIAKYVKQARHFSVKELKESVESCVETDEAIKTGKMNDKMAVELLIIESSHKIKE